jgi:hypothetical protein
MKVELTKIKGDWEEVANKARTTVHKDELGHEPSDSFKRKILRAEHSPIRSLIYCFKISNIKSWVATHLVRHHVGVEKWVRTQRSDRTGVNRDELPQGTEVEMEIEANAQALINMSRKRLCNQASPETKEVMKAMKEEVSKRDKFLAEVMVPECEYRGYCPEMKPCGFAETEKFKKELEEYRHPENKERE